MWQQDRSEQGRDEPAGDTDLLDQYKCGWCCLLLCDQFSIMMLKGLFCPGAPLWKTVFKCAFEKNFYRLLTNDAVTGCSQY